MKIAVTATGKGLDSNVDPRFGRCGYFIMFDTDSMQFEALANKCGESSGGAGIAAAKVVIDAGAKAVLTGNCGPNAHRALAAAGVKLYTTPAETVADAIEQFKAGKLAEAAGPNALPHSGTNT